jgi:hypothetical protein
MQQIGLTDTKVVHFWRYFGSSVVCCLGLALHWSMTFLAVPEAVQVGAGEHRLDPFGPLFSIEWIIDGFFSRYF